MNYALLINFIFILFSFKISAQSLIPLKSIRIDQPNEVSVDRRGNIYFATFDGDIIKLDSHLDSKEIFSPPNPNSTQILDAWQGLRVFTFHRDLQQFRLINRNLSLHENYQFPAEKIGFVELATPSFDNNIWLIDQSEFSLKKYLIHNQQIASNTSLQLLLDPNDYELLHCQEYQNRLFISTRNRGILIFDNLGNFIRIFDYTAIDHFSFWKNDLCFISDRVLVQINIYGDEIKSLVLPDGAKWEFALVYNDLVYLFSKNSITLYQQKMPE